MIEDIVKSALHVTRVLLLTNDVNVRTIFHNAGFKNVQILRAELSRARKIIAAGDCDLLVVEDLFDEEPTLPFIRAIRHGEVGDNIFLPIVAMISENEAGAIRASIDAGPDDVVAKPLSVGTINTRIVGLLKRNIQYVVTAEYIGPNRRSKERTDPLKDNLIDIPNVLRALSEGHHEVAKQIRAKIKEANKKINTQRVSIQGDQIQNLITEAIADPSEFGKCIPKIRKVALEFARRLQHTDFKHVGELCRMLNVVIREIRGVDDKKNIDLLVLLGQAIFLSFKDDVASRTRAMDVVMLINSKFKSEHVDGKAQPKSPSSSPPPDNPD